MVKIMKKYLVTNERIYIKETIVMAESEEDALHKVESSWSNYVSCLGITASEAVEINEEKDCE